MDSPGDVIGVPLLGFRGRVKQLGVDQRRWQNCQIIIQITVKGEEDEHRAMLRHRERGFITCEIYAKLALRRDVVRWALLRLRYSRVLPTACQNRGCDQIDGFSHLFESAAVGMPPEVTGEDDESQIDYLEGLTFHDYDVNPSFPAPLRSGVKGGISISLGGETQGGISSEHTPIMQFDIDDPV